MKRTLVFADLAKRYTASKDAMYLLQRFGSELIRLSKTAIFAMQRGADSPNEICSAEKILKKGQKIITRNPHLKDVGPWQAGLEEYAEALLFFAFIHEDQTTFHLVMKMDPGITIGALSDFVGELVRLAVREATYRHTERVTKIIETANEIVVFLTSLDLTGSQRSKGDQSRQHLRRLEDIRYDLSRHV